MCFAYYVCFILISFVALLTVFVRFFWLYMRILYGHYTYLESLLWHYLSFSFLSPQHTDVNDFIFLHQFYQLLHDTRYIDQHNHTNSTPIYFPPPSIIRFRSFIIYVHFFISNTEKKNKIEKKTNKTKQTKKYIKIKN